VNVLLGQGVFPAIPGLEMERRYMVNECNVLQEISSGNFD
jgi:hypothetical protein